MAPFVARARELAELRDLGSDAMRAAVPRTAVVVGGPGTGKSRLLHEAPALIGTAERFTVARYEPGRNVPPAAGSKAITTRPGGSTTGIGTSL